jgi:hypothetical protein
MLELKNTRKGQIDGYITMLHINTKISLINFDNKTESLTVYIVVACPFSRADTTLIYSGQCIEIFSKIPEKV